MRTLIRVSLAFASLLAVASSANAAGLPQLDATKFSPQIIWLVISFTILYLIMWRIALPKVGQVLEDRQRRISDNLAKAESLKAEAQAASNAYDAALAGARAKGHEVVGEARKVIADEAAKQHGILADKLNADIADGEARIAKAKAEAVASIRDVAIEVTGAAVQRLTGDDVDAKAVATVVDATMKERA